MIATLTEFASWYGAVVATGALAVSAYNAWRDSRRLRVVAKADMTVMDHPDFEDGETVIIIEVANVGRRTISLREFPSFPMRRSERFFAVKGPWLPQAEVAEGKSARMFCRQRDFPFDEVNGVQVMDETGKSWSGSIRRAEPKES